MNKLWRRKNLSGILLLLALVFLLAPPAYADIGVPMLLVIWPASWVLLLFIIPLEAAVPVHSPAASYRKRLRMAAAANIVSTLVGIPLTWGLLVGLQMLAGAGSAEGLDTPRQKLLAVTLQSPWLIPYESDLDWMIPAAAAVLCIPFFFMSVWCENLVARRFFDRLHWVQVRRWSWQANAASYALILLFLGLQLLMVLHQRGGL
jgi:hypothetical protein